jgi:hypothetical protein
MVTIEQGDTVRVRVLREDIDPGAPLFVTSTNPSIAAIAGPAGPLRSDGIFQIDAVKDVRNVAVKIQVHLGDVNGPVLGELEPHIFQLRALRVVAHLISINGGKENRTFHTKEDLVDFFNEVNVFWRAAGIRFIYDPAETKDGTIRGFQVNGQVTTTAKPPEFSEFSRLVNLVDPVTKDRPDDTAINIYFVKFAKIFIAATLDATHPRTQGFGIIQADRQKDLKVTIPGADIGTPRALAHELGHYLDMPLHAGELIPGKITGDIFSKRRLLFPSSQLNVKPETPNYRKDVGYGFGIPGSLVSVKDLSSERTDGEIARNRLRALDPNLGQGGPK